MSVSSALISCVGREPVNSLASRLCRPPPGRGGARRFWPRELATSSPARTKPTVRSCPSPGASAPLHRTPQRRGGARRRRSSVRKCTARGAITTDLLRCTRRNSPGGSVRAAALSRRCPSTCSGGDRHPAARRRRVRRLAAVDGEQRGVVGARCAPPARYRRRAPAPDVAAPPARPAVAARRGRGAPPPTTSSMVKREMAAVKPRTSRCPRTTTAVRDPQAMAARRAERRRGWRSATMDREEDEEAAGPDGAQYPHADHADDGCTDRRRQDQGEEHDALAGEGRRRHAVQRDRSPHDGGEVGAVEAARAGRLPHGAPSYPPTPAGE